MAGWVGKFCSVHLTGFDLASHKIIIFFQCIRWVWPSFRAWHATCDVARRQNA